MSLRVTQRTMYNQFINQMQGNLGAYMESNIQGSSQKKINRPSDDPAGMALVLNYRNTIGNTEQLQRNLDTAQGWLTLADSTLNQVSATITEIKTLAEQAATSTMTAENRNQVATQLRELFGQLLSLSNTEFEGKSIFAGHKYSNNAYELGLGLSCLDEDFYNESTEYKIEGNSDKTIMLRFSDSADLTGGPQAGLNYEWTDNGGDTWNKGGTTTVDGNNTVVDMNGVQLKIAHNDPKNTGKSTVITAYTDPENTSSEDNGTAIYIRPTTYYQGDDNDPPPTVESSPPLSNSANASAKGSFAGKAQIRVTDAAKGEYSYSMDNGTTWVKATTTDATSAPTRFLVPGGYLDVKEAVSDGQQFVIRPHEADLKYEIMSGSYVSVTNVGKDIFGGMYQEFGDTVARPVFDDHQERNLFEIVGKLIGWCETNNQDGISQCVADLGEAQKVILTAAASVGGRENRLTLAKDVLSFQKLDQEERLSYTEDVDLTELLTRMAQQELAYNTVLKSSSMIMQLNLTKFV